MSTQNDRLFALYAALAPKHPQGFALNEAKDRLAYFEAKTPSEAPASNPPVAAQAVRQGSAPSVSQANGASEPLTRVESPEFPGYYELRHPEDDGVVLEKGWPLIYESGSKATVSGLAGDKFGSVRIRVFAPLPKAPDLSERPTKNAVNALASLGLKVEDRA